VFVIPAGCLRWPGQVFLQSGGDLSGSGELVVGEGVNEQFPDGPQVRDRGLVERLGAGRTAGVVRESPQVGASWRSRTGDGPWTPCYGWGADFCVS
jgi:hypothetical protein